MTKLRSNVDIMGEHDPAAGEAILEDEGSSEDGDIIDNFEPDDAAEQFSGFSGPG